MESIQRAVELGADSIEIDIHLLKDETLSVFHDFHVPASTAPKFIGDLTVWEMKKIGAPTLLEVFGLLKSFPSSNLLWLDLELKYLEGHPSSPEREKLVEAVLDCVSMNWQLNRTKFRSFDWKILKCFQAKSVSSVQTIPLLGKTDGDFNEALKLQTEWLAPHVDMLDEKRVSWAHRLGLKIMPYTVNFPADWKKLAGWGVDGITTDDPEGLLQFLERSNR